jgi:hypothetical protein
LLDLNSIPLRAFLPIFAAIIGGVVSLFVGGVAAAGVVAVSLFAMGDPHPNATLDAAFGAHPMGLPALIIITAYVSIAGLGGFLSCRIARRFALRLQSIPHRSSDRADKPQNP